MGEYTESYAMQNPVPPWNRQSNKPNYPVSDSSTTLSDPYSNVAQNLQQHSTYNPNQSQFNVNFYPGPYQTQDSTRPSAELNYSHDDQFGSKPLTTEDDSDELPLLEELGIHPNEIFQRMRSALIFYKIDEPLLQNVDTCGPMFIVICLGAFLLLAGKVHFTYVYGLSITGIIGVFVLLNLMSQKRSLSGHQTISILGYGLSPVVLLALVSIFKSLRTLTGMILSGATAVWCTAIASRFFEKALEMQHQRFLVAYPLLILYGSFVLITVF